MLLTLGVHTIGIMSYTFYDRQQRAAFLETRQSLETKLILEQESREQVSSSIIYPSESCAQTHRHTHAQTKSLSMEGKRAAVKEELPG